MLVVTSSLERRGTDPRTTIISVKLPEIRRREAI